ncbi:MAG: sulfite exporter TauE/SafE family protein [Candidatus Eisenbacteria bacterium]|nr:sulfite exporter TauE/SafE family protein [Candidatus Eisenbacteria bacterium]
MSSEVVLLVLVSLVASTVSGVLGMGGGVLLIASMAAVLPAAVVVPVHGVVQLVSNFTRTLRLLGHVKWRIAALYVPGLAIGVWVALRLYQGSSLAWFKPAIGAFVLAFLVWDRVKPKHLQVPLWIFFPVGIGAGFITMLVGAAGPFLAAFFLRDDLERREVIATKAFLQTFGHALKIPAFLSLGFDYSAELHLIVPMLASVIVGTFLGTWLLGRMKESLFRKVFRWVLAALALRLLATPWI